MLCKAEIWACGHVSGHSPLEVVGRDGRRGLPLGELLNCGIMARMDRDFSSYSVIYGNDERNKVETGFILRQLDLTMRLNFFTHISFSLERQLSRESCHPRGSLKRGSIWWIYFTFRAHSIFHELGLRLTCLKKTTAISVKTAKKGWSPLINENLQPKCSVCSLLTGRLQI